MHEKPNIYTYVSYREFLLAQFQYLKSSKKNFSYRYVSQKVGSSSPSWLSDIIKERINITEGYVSKLAQLFGLSRKEERFFKLLIYYDQAGTHELKQKYLEDIFKNRDIKVDVLTQKKFEYFRKWYIPVVREYLFISAFDGTDKAAFSRLIRPQISVKELDEALDVLETLSLIKLDEDGFFRPTEQTVSKDSSIASVLIPAYHHANLKLAGESIERFPKHERNISSVTMALSKEQYALACDELSQLREKLLAMSETVEDAHAVYQCNLQLFPVTYKGDNNA